MKLLLIIIVHIKYQSKFTYILLKKHINQPIIVIKIFLIIQWLKAKTKKTLPKKDTKRKLLTLWVEKSGSNSEHQLHSRQSLSVLPALTGPKVLVKTLWYLEKVEDSIRGRVVIANQADLAPNQDAFAWRKIKLIVDETRGRDALTSFYGVDMTRDQLSSLIKKEKHWLRLFKIVNPKMDMLFECLLLRLPESLKDKRRKLTML